ncbi:hypothetical protein V5799_026197 [Amblyomma americanum]|uniref:Flavin-containing monooxygenase n=1 Tax=Amblyomma americanum TaxID=6943 RepID=A0AAQ4DJ91_AMBAM
MVADIERTESAQRTRYVSSPRHTIQVDYMPYTRDLARRIGADPSLTRALLQRRPLLFWALLSGPQVPYMFRLQGPHSWHGAEQAVLGTRRRIVTPLRTRHEVGDAPSALAADKLLLAPALELAVVVATVCVLLVPLLADYLFA